MAGFCYAYALPCSPIEAREHPSSERLRRAWPGGPDGWMAYQGRTGGSVAVFPRGDGAAVPLESFGPPHACADGLTYYPSLVPATGEDLIRPERQRLPGEWLDLHDGGSLYVSLALCSPRKLLMSTSAGFKRGDYATEMGRLGHEIYQQFTDKREDLAETDPRLFRLVSLVLQAGYHVTEEMIEDGLPFQLTDRDINPILLLCLGADPKSLAAEPAPLPSAPAPTPTSP